MKKKLAIQHTIIHEHIVPTYIIKSWERKRIKKYDGYNNKVSDTTDGSMGRCL